MRHFRRLRSLTVLTALVMISAFIAPAFSETAFAQSSKGILVGTITDPSGARLEGARVKITNAQTGVARETVTTGEGQYRLDAVDPGTYTIEVTSDGFKTFTLENVTVVAAQATTSDFTLEVGTPSEVINVTADTTVVLQQQDGARTNTLEERQIVDLPIAGLNPVNLVFTLPGVTDPGVLAGGFVQGTEFNINGLRARANNQLIDGTDNNDNSITGQQIQPILRDGYREVTVLGGNYSAEYGRAGGAVVNVVTKSGTNEFHGSVYDVLDTSALATLSPGQKANQGLTETPVYTQNSFGFSLGGPIKRDKLFFFGTFQPTLTRSTVQASAVVPTTEGFNQLRALFPQGASANLDRYLSVVGNLRGTTNPVSVELGGGRPDIEFATVTTSSSQPVDTYDLLGRVDWTPTINNSFAARYMLQEQTFKNQLPTVFSGFEVDTPSRVQNFYFNYTRVLSTVTTNEFRLSYGRFNVQFEARDPGALDFGPTIIFGGIPASLVGALGDVPATFPQGRIFNNYQVQDTITYTRGSHTVRAGVDLLRQIAKQSIPFDFTGTLTFSASQDDPATPEDETFPTFGNFVDAFSGTQGNFATKTFGDPVIRPNAFQQAYFINDSWRVRPNLTLNLGLRYEHYGTPFNVIPFPAFAGFDVPLDARVEQNSDDNNFAPRFSFAYTPQFNGSSLFGRLFGQDATVIRGGYAVSYDVFFNNILSNNAAASPNVFGVNTFGISVGGRGFRNAGSGSLPTTGSPDPATRIDSISPDLVNPQSHVWNLGVQRQLPGNFIIDAAYVGSRGMRQFINELVNPGVPGNPEGVDGLPRLFPTRGAVVLRTNGGDSNYHSLQTRVERGFKDGLLMRFAYTWSKAIDNVNSEVFVTTGGASRASNPFNRDEDRSVASFDVPHRAVWSFVYDVPGPKTGWLGQVAGFWTVSGIYRLQSGAVETPFVGGIDLNGDTEAFNDRPAVGNPNAPANSVAFADIFFGEESPTGFFDLNGNVIALEDARYIVDPAIRTNIAGRNTLRAERVNTLDLSLTKSFNMPFEAHRLEVRFDFFNLFNHPNFTWANPAIGSDQGNGDVLNPFFNNVRVNDGGIFGPAGNTVGRYGRVQVRYSF